MTNLIYDIGIIGVGTAGAFCCYQLAVNYPKQRVIAFDLGRPPAKRRRQLEGFLGCLPSSDGKLYLNDIRKVADLVGLKKAKNAFASFKTIMKEVNSMKVIKDAKPYAKVSKKLEDLGYEIELNDYIQIYPKEIHQLSKNMVKAFEEVGNIDFEFDDEVLDINKKKGIFTITSEYNEYKCRKLIMATGRGGWRFAQEIYKKFGIIEENDYCKFGIRIEGDSKIFANFNGSNCGFKKGDEIEIDHLNWNSTIIPIDLLEFNATEVRGNEKRWITDKVSFQLIGNRYFKNKGCEQLNRIASLNHIIVGERILKERLSLLLNNKSKLNIMPEFDWIKDVVKELEIAIPNLLEKGYFHTPTVLALPSKINVGSNLSTEVEGLYCTGENIGLIGIISAAITGIIVANEVVKGLK